MYNMLRKLREERAEGDRGFTLIELLVVVVIIGILVAIAIPIYLNYEHGAQNKSAESDARNAAGVMEQCKADNNGSLQSITGMPATATPTNVDLTCGTETETLVVSSGNSMKIAVASDNSYVIDVTSANNKTFEYDSKTGHTSAVSGSPTPAAT